VAQQIFEAVRLAVEAIGHAEFRVGKSQVSFRRRKPFARVWMPGQYLSGRVAPLVLALSLRSPDGSPRWKEIIEPKAGRFTHHLELYSTADVDDHAGYLRDGGCSRIIEALAPKGMDK
jgi:hypothetical protein